MTTDEVNCYRDGIDKQIQETFKEIDSNISYIIVGSIGFFITMLDKFVDVKTATWKPFMFLSIILLLTSFACFLFTKYATTKNALKILNFVDDKLVPKPDDIANEQVLLKMWDKSHKSLQNYRMWTYITLTSGLIFLVIFFTSNFFMNNDKRNEDSSQKLKIEIVTKDSSKTIYEVNAIIDTLKK